MTVVSNRNAEVFAANAEVIAGGVSSSNRSISPPIVFEAANGAMITDADGNQYIDYHCAFGPIILGHCHPRVNERVAATLGRLDLFGIGTTPLEGQLARKLIEHVPSAEMVFFCNSGSEATYHALRLARAVTRRKKIIKFQGCYHGWHDSVAMNVISPADRIGRHDPISAGTLEEVTKQTLVLPFNDVGALENAFRLHRREIAAVILEPVPHNIGAVFPTQDFLAALRVLTADEESVLIFDEVVSGFRHALGGFQATCPITPDLTTLGKAIANGYPLAAMVGRRELMEQCAPPPMGRVFTAGTFNAHAGCLAAGLATVAELEQPGVYERLERDTNLIRSTLDQLINQLGLPAQTAGSRSIWLVYFMEGQIRHFADLLHNNNEMDVAFRRGLMARGVFSLPVAYKRNHLTLSHEPEHIARTLQAAEDVLRLLAARKPTQ